MKRENREVENVRCGEELWNKWCLSWVLKSEYEFYGKKQGGGSWHSLEVVGYKHPETVLEEPQKMRMNTYYMKERRRELRW